MQVKCLCVVTRRDLLLVCGRVYCPAVRTKKTPLMDKISIAWVTCGIYMYETACSGAISQMLRTVVHVKALEKNAHCACPACPPRLSAHRWIAEQLLLDSHRSLPASGGCASCARVCRWSRFVCRFVCRNAEVHRLGARPPRQPGAARWWRHPPPAAYLPHSEWRGVSSPPPCAGAVLRLAPMWA